MGREDYERWDAETISFQERVLAAVEALPTFAGTQERHETRELLLFGVGLPSEELLALIEKAPSSIRVTWTEAPFTLKELTAEVHRILAEQPLLTGGSALCDGTGIRFETTDADLLNAADPRQVLATRYPVTLEFGERLKLL